MPIKMRIARREEPGHILEMQKAAFEKTYERFHDDGTSPFCESISDIERRFGRAHSLYMIVSYAGRDAGAVRVERHGDEMKISPVFFMPEFQGRGTGTRVIGDIRAIWPDVTRWYLDTIAQCTDNCRFYEKLGFRRFGEPKHIQAGMDLVDYEWINEQPVRRELAEYVRDVVLPEYAAFDEGHDAFHALHVIGAALDMARENGINAEIAYAAAACHDRGLCCGRQNHHMDSGRIVRADAQLREFFTEDEVERIARACEDHRASGGAPRDMLGRIIADADRELEAGRLIYRTLMYGRGHFPELGEAEQIERVIEHIREKYGPEGYLRVWTDSGVMRAQKRVLCKLLEQPERIREICRSFGVL